VSCPFPRRSSIRRRWAGRPGTAVAGQPRSRTVQEARAAPQAWVEGNRGYRSSVGLASSQRSLSRRSLTRLPPHEPGTVWSRPHLAPRRAGGVCALLVAEALGSFRAMHTLLLESQR
jgi:hypothetical protein